MSWELFVSARYLLGRQKGKFISITSVISILGIAVGVAALIVVIGVMSGFDEELQNKVMGINAHLIVVSDTPIQKVPDTEVEAGAEFVNGQAMLTKGKEMLGVLLKGIKAEDEVKVTKVGEYLKAGSLPFGDNEATVGSELANKFGVGIGDILSVLSLGSKKPIGLKVCGIFTSGMYEYDLNLVFTNIKTAQDILGMGSAISGVALKIKEPLKAEEVKGRLQRLLGYPYWVRTWMDMNRNLFSAIRLEKLVMFIILGLIVLVACFNIASTLIMTVIEKTKDIGILKSIGSSNSSIMKIFMFEGLLIGALGAFIGGGAGLWLGRLLNRYPLVKLFGLEEIYYFERLPVKIETADFLLVTGMALLISLCATLYPAFRAGRLNPIEALRYE